MKFDTTYGGRNFLATTFRPAAHIAAGTHEVWVPNPDAGEHDHRYNGRWVRPVEGRAWFRREHSRHKLHPAIEHVIESANYRPIDWQQLLLEWPHRSTTDSNRLAYTRDETAGNADRQVVTTIGKYLQRHFVMPDHEIRNVVALYTSQGEMKLLNTMDGIVDAIRNGPTSCMSHNISIRCDDGVSRHPYQVYNPELGWSMAVRIHNGQIDGRALVYEDDNHHYYVRSYKRCLNGGYSYADERIESWLEAQGIKKMAGWGGARIAAYSVGEGYLAPYIDGNDEYVYYDLDSKCLIVTEESGEDCYQARETSGYTANAGGEVCEDCDTRCDEDDMYWVGRWEDRRVCCSCCDNDYTYAYGNNGNQYYIHNDDVVDVHGDWYDVNYLSDNDIVTLADGDYSHIDNAVYIEAHDEYYADDDSDICYAEDTGRYELRDDCWQCSDSDKWFTDDVDYVEVDGDKYHPDYAPEEDDEDDEVEVVANESNEWLPAPALDAHFGVAPPAPRIVAETVNDSLTDSINYNYLRNAR